MTSLFFAETPSFRGWMLSLISVMIHTILAPTPRAVGYERSEAALLWRKAPKRTPSTASEAAEAKAEAAWSGCAAMLLACSRLLLKKKDIVIKELFANNDLGHCS